MGGAVAVLVAAARPAVVSLLVMAEGNVGPEGGDRFDGQSEDRFVERGFPDLLDGQEKEATANPEGLRASHVGITRLVEPRAIYREAASMEVETTPTLRSHLGRLEMPRWYLIGGLSVPEPELEQEMAGLGVGWKVVPETGHAMGLENPQGLAQTVAEVLPASWAR
jgi:pimeloyl-ACP methyl ester carboxylesterase